jgi:hypothetical protein
MDKRQVVDILSANGISVKPNQVKEIRTIGVRNNVNSAGASLSDYQVRTTRGYFAITEELVPNKWGSTAFSTDKRFVIVHANELVDDSSIEEENEIEEEATTEGNESEGL